MMADIGRVKACTECRQQKVRCDAFRDYSQPCTRCRAADLPCVISKDFRRRPKQSKAQLQHEIDRLRAQAGPSDESHGGQTSPSSYAHSIEQTARKRKRGDTISPQETAHQIVHSFAHSELSPSLREHLQPYSTPLSEPIKDGSDRPETGWSEPTMSRSLETVILESQQIDDCYASFMNHYAPYLEGLFDSEVSPNEKYQQSPLLFWTMVLVGARGYEKDPTIYNRLGEPVLDLIFQSCLRPQQPLFVIQAVIIFCNWPLPIDLIYQDPAHALAGAAMGIALQNGLHMYTREQDFVIRGLQSLPKLQQAGSRSRDRARDEVVVFRARIWAYCYLVLQNTFMGDGLPPPAPTPCFRRSMVNEEILCLLPETMAFRLRLHKLQVDALNLVINSCDLEANKSEPTLNAAIRAFEERVLETALPQDIRLHRFLRKSTQVFVLGLTFLVQQDPPREDILRLYRISRELVAGAEELSHEVRNFAFFMPQSLMRIIFLAGHILLRVPKSPLGRDLDMTDAEAAVKQSIDLFTKRSMTKKDIDSLQIAVLKQLWQSDRAFVRDGQPQNGVRIDVRYRLVFNPVFDNVWWWRMEFGSMTNSSNNDSQQQQPPPPPPASHPQQGIPPHRSTGDFNFPSTWSTIPPDASGPNVDNISKLQDMMPISGAPYNAFFGGGSMENTFDGFMDWWDLSAFPMDTFQTELDYNYPSALGDLSNQMFLADSPKMDFAG